MLKKRDGIKRRGQDRERAGRALAPTLCLSNPSRSKRINSLCLRREASVNLHIVCMTDWILIEGACTHPLESQVSSSPRIKNSHSPPMTLMTSQSLPPSSAISITIISQSIDLAGLAHGENSLTLHCFLTKSTYQSI